MEQTKKSSVKSSLKWTEILKGLADETRLLIIYELLKHEATVTELSGALGIQLYNISRHLKILERCGLLEKRQKGLNKIYRITESIANSFSENDQILDLGCCKFSFKELDKCR